MPRFLTLPSDSSTQYWPNNTSSHFRVHLSKPLDFDLNESYEVALCQFQYSHAYVNLPGRIANFEIRRVSDARHAKITPPMLAASNALNAASNALNISDTAMDTQQPPATSDFSSFYYGTVQPGHYKNAADLTKGINRAIMKALEVEYDIAVSSNRTLLGRAAKITRNVDDDCSAFIRAEFFVYDEVSNKVRCEANNLELIQRYTDVPEATVDHYTFCFHPELRLRLGFTKDVPANYQLGDHERHSGFYNRGDYLGAQPQIWPGNVGESTVDHNLGFHNIYIYSDIIKESNTVGETLQSCLRVVPIADENRNQMVLVEPLTLQFFPLRSNHVQDVEIVLRTDTGAITPFQRGNSVVTLVIRRASPLDIDK